jgi:hypothetical protein
MARRRSSSPLRRDHARPRTHPASLDPVLEQHLTALVQPATYALVDQYHRLGLRERILSLPVMVALVLTLIWRQVPSVSTLVQMLAREPLLWSPPHTVSQQALSARLGSLPASLFEEVVHAILPQLQERAMQRHRPLPPVLVRARHHVSQIWSIDATTLEALFKKVGTLRDVAGVPHGGTLLAVLDVCTRLPVQLTWDATTGIGERTLLDRVLASIPEQTLVLLDRGFYGFALFDHFTEHEIRFITRARSDAAFAVTQVLQETDTCRDRLIQFGQFRSNPCSHPVRLVELHTAHGWHAYLTNMLDPAIVSPEDVAALYGHRWRIEEAFSLVKRLLGLSYLWTGSVNGIQLQVWATWLLYAVLIDLSDQIAEVKGLPLHRISVEMVYRGLYHFSVAFAQGTASDPVAYLASQDDLGIVKRLRIPRERVDKHQLILNL